MILALHEDIPVSHDPEIYVGLRAVGETPEHPSFTGDLNDGKFSGGASLSNGFIRLSGLDAPIDAITGKIRVEDSRFSLDGLNA